MATATRVNKPKVKVEKIPAKTIHYHRYPDRERRSLTITGAIGGQKFEFTASMRERPYRLRPTYDAPRWVRSTDSESYRSYHAKPKLYFHVSDESVLDNFMNRTTRPARLWGGLARQVLAVVFGDTAGKIGWSQNAGCRMCPCSPGFIWGPAPELDFGTGPTCLYDAWIVLEGAPAVVETPEALGEQAHRLAGLASDPTIDLGALAGIKL